MGATAFCSTRPLLLLIPSRMDWSKSDSTAGGVDPKSEFAQGYFDMIWALPPCAEYSRALTRRPRRLKEGDRTAIRTLELIRDLRPRFWCIENPQTGLLKRRPFMANLPFSDVTYCKYGYPYKKATRLWHNLPWVPEHLPCCARSRCAWVDSLDRMVTAVTHGGVEGRSRKEILSRNRSKLLP